MCHHCVVLWLEPSYRHKAKTGRHRVLRQLMSLPLLAASHMCPAFDDLTATAPTSATPVGRLLDYILLDMAGEQHVDARQPHLPLPAGGTIEI